jgi:hypothetical protein
VSSAAGRDDYTDLDIDEDRRSTATGVSGYRGRNALFTGVLLSRAINLPLRHCDEKGKLRVDSLIFSGIVGIGTHLLG